MMTNSVFAIGLMSGTSLDGVDLVYVQFDLDDYQSFIIHHASTYPYDELWKKKLQEAIDYPKSALDHLDLDYGRYLGQLIQQFRIQFGIDNIDFIASHGHTVLHQPNKGITLQVGDGRMIANITGIQTVCDFRSQDVFLGGQGAPLVPIGDQLLFSKYEACLNLGGFSNISYQQNNERIAYDICPVNIVLNYYAQKLGFSYDEGGTISKKGGLNLDLLTKLNQLDYYYESPPKSLGLEWVQQFVLPLIDKFEKDVPAILHTFSHHIAFQIAKEIGLRKKVLITGGGAWNNFLMELINKETHIDNVNVSPEIIDYKEALVFAFLGLLRINNENNCLSSVTGASKDHCSGVVFTPDL